MLIDMQSLDKLEIYELTSWYGNALTDIGVMFNVGFKTPSNFSLIVEFKKAKNVKFWLWLPPNMPNPAESKVKPGSNNLKLTELEHIFVQLTCS